MDPETAEREVVWRVRQKDAFSDATPVILRVKARRQRAVPSSAVVKEREKAAARSGLFVYSSAAEDELRIIVDEIEVQALDGAVLGVARPAAKAKRRKK